MTGHDIFDSISAIDYRYWDKDTAKCLSENGFTQHKLRVELALVAVLCRRGICSKEAYEEVKAACERVTTKAVYEREAKTRHDIRALVDCICDGVSKETKPYVHMTATSFDIIDTANALRFRDTALDVLIPALKELEKVLINITLREAETAQIGRTHGQHAVPITFGFAIAWYVSRLGNSILALKNLSTKLNGKFSGAVGSHNAAALFFDDPEDFEREVLEELGLLPAEHSTQIVPPEPMIRFLGEATTAMGILANLARDMRHLQRTEIAEVKEEFVAGQTGSSAMPHKNNPISFENVESIWKIVLARFQTVLSDQVSEHQRDLTGSASARTYGEIIAYVIYATKRMKGVMKKLVVDHESLKRNLAMQQGLVLSEPFHLILASLGHPNSHEKMKELAQQAGREKRPLEAVVQADVELEDYLAKMTPRQRQITSDPACYVGVAAQKAKEIAERWKQKLGI
jgi:adenylosuccinate lyase